MKNLLTKLNNKDLNNTNINMQPKSQLALKKTDRKKKFESKL